MNLNTEGIQEYCQGEVHDFLLSLVRKELRNIPPDFRCRRKDLCQAILDRNKEIGNRSTMQDGMNNILQKWESRRDQFSALEKLGFVITKGKTHCKIRVNGFESGHFLSLSLSPSDRREGRNASRDANLVFF